MPVPDPAWKDAIQWEGDFTNFPGGPLYWIHGDENKIQAIATGTANEHQRKQGVCVVSDNPKVAGTVANGHASAGQESKEATDGLEGLSLVEKLPSFPKEGSGDLSEGDGKVDISATSEAVDGNDQSAEVKA
jgi:hypothetical protein